MTGSLLRDVNFCQGAQPPFCTSFYVRRSFLLSGTTLTLPILPQEGPPEHHEAYDINEEGTLAGEHGTNQFRSFTWSAFGGVTLYPLLSELLCPSIIDRVLSINSLGQLTGEEIFFCGTGLSSFTLGLQSQNGTSLTRLGWTITEANSMNERGEVVGVGLKQGRSRGFLLRLLKLSATPKGSCAMRLVRGQALAPGSNCQLRLSARDSRGVLTRRKIFEFQSTSNPLVAWTTVSTFSTNNSGIADVRFQVGQDKTFYRFRGPINDASLPEVSSNTVPVAVI